MREVKSSLLMDYVNSDVLELCSIVKINMKTGQQIRVGKKKFKKFILENVFDIKKIEESAGRLFYTYTVHFKNNNDLIQILILNN